MNEKRILTLSCLDQPGIVAAVTSFLFESNTNILEAQQFDDVTTGRFFMRVVFETLGEAQQNIASSFEDLAQNFGMDWQITSKELKKKVIIFVSKFDHCLGDLLYRTRIGELKMDIVGIISNHPKSALNLTMVEGIPYHHLAISKTTKPKQEAMVKEIIEETGAQLVILARYMQILSDDLSNYLEGRCVNIHHSFLPGFKGAKPYHQAYNRGVKMIGATAHFVTPDLDEGPIIVQDVEPISHADSPTDLVRKGRNIEQRVLAKAVTYLLEDRVLLNGHKTVVFEN